jgi:hypothetical protein
MTVRRGEEGGRHSNHTFGSGFESTSDRNDVTRDRVNVDLPGPPRDPQAFPARGQHSICPILSVTVNQVHRKTLETVPRLLQALCALSHLRMYRITRRFSNHAYGWLLPVIAKIMRGI